MASLWYEKYRPATLAGYVWSSESLRISVMRWIADSVVPDVMFTGGAGRGKTTLARAVLREIGIPTSDILDINASKYRKPDDLIDRIATFCSTWSMNETGFKYVILDEADKLTPLTQDVLRNEIEKHSESVRFILTANNRNKFTEPMHSRFQEFIFNALDFDEATLRIVDILEAEKIDFDAETLMPYIEATYPDMRKCIQVVQQKSDSGRLMPFRKDEDGAAAPYLTEMVELWKAGAVREARKLVIDRAKAEDYPDIFRFLYRNLDLWADTQHLQDEALLIVRDGIVKHGTVYDVEINLAATLVSLSRLRA